MPSLRNMLRRRERGTDVAVFLRLDYLVTDLPALRAEAVAALRGCGIDPSHRQLDAPGCLEAIFECRPNAGDEPGALAEAEWLFAAEVPGAEVAFEHDLDPWQPVLDYVAADEEP